jgi:hypothetical protein
MKLIFPFTLYSGYGSILRIAIDYCFSRRRQMIASTLFPTTMYGAA